MIAMRIPLALAGVCGLLVVAPGEITAWLVFDRDAILAGEAWRLWTGHLVHFSWLHALTDVMVLFVVSHILAHHTGSRVVVLALLAGAPFISLGLLLAVPDLRVYAGASGIAMMIGVAVGCVLWCTDHRLRGVIGVLALVALIKLLMDANSSGLVHSTLPAGVQIAWQAHAIGACLGWLLAQNFAARSRSSKWSQIELSRVSRKHEYE